MKTLVTILISTLLIFSSCLNSEEKKESEKSNPHTIILSKVVAYGNGVYYFPFKESEFGHSVSLFIQYHPDLQLTAMTGDQAAGQGRNRGYFAVFKKKQYPKMDK